MRSLIIFLCLFFVVSLSANDSISIWHEQYTEFMQLQNYAEAENAASKILNSWKREQLPIDKNYLTILIYQYLPIFLQGKYVETEPIIDEIFMHWELMEESKESETYSLLLLHKSMIMEYKKEKASIIIPIIKEALDIDTKLFGRRSVNNITTLIRLAEKYDEEGQYSIGLQYAEECVSISRELLPANDKYFATYLLILSELYHSTGNFKRALETITEASSIYMSILGDNSIAYIKTLVDMSLCYADLNDYDNALSIGMKALNKCKAQGKHTILRTTLDALARVNFEMGNYHMAIDYCLDALSVSEEIGEYGKEPYQTILSNLAIYYSHAGNNKKAIEIQLKSLELAKKLYGTKHPIYATSLSNLGLIYFDIDDLENAKRYAEQALEIRIDNNDKIGCINSYEALSLISVEYGNLTNAIKYAKKALDMCPPHTKHYARCLSNLGACYETTGSFERALEYENKALLLRRRVLGPNHPDYIKSLASIAIINYRTNKHQEALEYGQKSLEATERCFGKTHPQYAHILGNVAEYNACLGNISSAISLQEEAKILLESFYGKNSSSYATAVGNIANYQAAQNDYKEAIINQKKALKIRKQIYGENHMSYVQSLNNLSSYYEELHDYKSALQYEDVAIEKLQNICIKNIFSLSTYNRKNYWFTIKNKFLNKYSKLHYYNHTSDCSAFYNSQLFAKGLLLRTEIDVLKTITETNNNSIHEKYQNLRRANAILKGLSNRSSISPTSMIDSLQKSVEKEEEELLAMIGTNNSFKIRWNNVRENLQNEDIAIEFVQIPIHNDSVMYIALTVRNDSEYPKMTYLFEERQLKEVSDTLYYQCKDMTDLVWSPLLPELKGIQNIYFSPSGALYNIGIEYLPGMEGYNTYRLSSTRELVTNKKRDKENHAVLYGGLDYYALPTLPQKPNKDSLSSNLCVEHSDVRGMKLRGGKEYLPQTKVEVEKISKEFVKTKWTYKMLTGSKGTEESFKSLSGKNIKSLHISTHGFYYTPDEAQNIGYLFLQFDDNFSSEEDKALTRSGLIMSGANHILEGEGLPDNIEDGILTAKEIADVDLRGLDLVVLSACQTGLGDISQGEGVFGLQRGFKKAGANTILMSLWEVNDEATQILMTQFYKNLVAGMSKRQSLQSAQKYLRMYRNEKGKQCYNEPKYWAAFILLDGIEQN